MRKAIKSGDPFIGEIIAKDVENFCFVNDKQIIILSVEGEFYRLGQEEDSKVN